MHFPENFAFGTRPRWLIRDGSVFLAVLRRDCRFFAYSVLTVKKFLDGECHNGTGDVGRSRSNQGYASIDSRGQG